MDASGLIVLLVVIALALWFGRRHRGAGGRSGRGTGADPLVRACGGDAAKAERLATHEQRRDPELSPQDARRRALERLRRDR